MADDAPASPGAPADPDATRLAATTPSAGPPATPPKPGRRLAGYELIAELGRGGMGVVWKAWRPDLQAHFAVKVLLAGAGAAPEVAERFHREAQAAARLRHPAIVSVHDAGIEDDKAYLVMDFIEGTSLAAATRAHALAPRDTARLVREVAGAVEYAHRQGVIHRDLKPGNILLDRAGRPRIVDFGLAKLVATEHATAAAPLTRTGTVMGTLAYMAPEQAGGHAHEIDTRCDLYSLGVILYELLTGRLPFAADTQAELLMKVLLDEPPPPRALNPALPADLETVVLKAMAKEPARRYGHAADLAADLGRFLDGQAISARPATITHGVARWLQRRRALAAVLAAVALVGGAAAGLAWRARRADRDAESLRTHYLEDLRRKAARYVAATLALRRSGSPMKKPQDEYLPALRLAVAAADRELPDRAEPHYHLGRLLRALLQFVPALAEQDEAVRREPGFAPARYERAVLTVDAFSRRLAVLRQEARAAAGARASAAGLLDVGTGATERLAIPPDDQLAQADPEAARLHARLREDLARLAGPASAPPDDPTAAADPPPAWLDCARGLALTYESTRPEDRQCAADLLRRALRADPTLEEAYAGLATLAVAAGRWDEAIAVYAQGIGADAGYVPFWIGRGIAHGNRTPRRTPPVEDPDRHFADAVADLTRALELEPAAAPVWVHRGGFRTNWGDDRVERGQDPRAAWDAAEADFGQAIELAPASAEAWTGRAGLRTSVARYQVDQGVDAEAAFAAAEADYAQALERTPAAPRAWASRAALRKEWAWYRGSRGRDPEPTFAAAEGDCARALELDPTAAEGWSSRANLCGLWGLSLAMRGRDPEPRYTTAEAYYAKALELAPAAAELWVNRGKLRTHWGAHRRTHGGDPEPCFAAAAGDLGKALELAPTSTEAWSGRANLRSNWAIAKADRGQDPTALYAGGEADFTRVLELDPAGARRWGLRAVLRLNWGSWEKDHGRDPERLYAGAAADLAQALKLNPAGVEGWIYRGGLRVNWGGWQAARGVDPEAQYRDGLADFTQAIALNPAWVEAWSNRASLRVNWAEYRSRRGGDPAPLYADALADYAQALKLSPAVASTWTYRGLLQMNWGLYVVGHGGDARRLFADAIADLTKAIGLDANSAEAWADRGQARWCVAADRTRRGEDPRAAFAEAAADLGQALARNPGDAVTWRARGELLRVWGDFRREHGEDPAEQYRDSMRCLDEALGRNAGDALAFGQRGVARARVGRWAEAVADLEAAVRLDPGLAGALKAALETVRAQAAAAAGGTGH